MTIRRYADYVIKYDCFKEGTTIYYTCTPVSARLDPQAYIRLLQENASATTQDPATRLTLKSMVDADRNPATYLKILRQGVNFVNQYGALNKEYRIAKRELGAEGTGEIELLHPEFYNHCCGSSGSHAASTNGKRSRQDQETSSAPKQIFNLNRIQRFQQAQQPRFTKHAAASTSTTTAVTTPRAKAPCKDRSHYYYNHHTTAPSSANSLFSHSASTPAPTPSAFAFAPTSAPSAVLPPRSYFTFSFDKPLYPTTTPSAVTFSRSTSSTTSSSASTMSAAPSSASSLEDDLETLSLSSRGVESLSRHNTGIFTNASSLYRKNSKKREAAAQGTKRVQVREMERKRVQVEEQEREREREQEQGRKKRRIGEKGRTIWKKIKTCF